jgi:hypothetical protein
MQVTHLPAADTDVGIMAPWRCGHKSVDEPSGTMDLLLLPVAARNIVDRRQCGLILSRRHVVRTLRRDGAGQRMLLCKYCNNLFYSIHETAGDSFSEVIKRDASTVCRIR